MEGAICLSAVRNKSLVHKNTERVKTTLTRNIHSAVPEEPFDELLVKGKKKKKTFFIYYNALEIM